jgi:hypothetical protein
MHVSWIIIRLLSIACAAFPLHTFSATVFKFSDTPPRITAHQPGLPGIRYSFLLISVISTSSVYIKIPSVSIGTPFTSVGSTNTAPSATTILFLQQGAHYAFIVVTFVLTGD